MEFAMKFKPILRKYSHSSGCPATPGKPGICGIVWEVFFGIWGKHGKLHEICCRTSGKFENKLTFFCGTIMLAVWFSEKARIRRKIWNSRFVRKRFRWDGFPSNTGFRKHKSAAFQNAFLQRIHASGFMEFSKVILYSDTTDSRRFFFFKITRILCVFSENCQ